MKRTFTILTAALALLAFLALPMGMRGQTTVASFVRNGNSNTITGGEFTTTFSAKSGYYQDANGDCYMQILNTDAYWTTTPTSISFAAKLGGGTGNHDLSNPVYVSLLDANGDVIDETETEVTSHITTNTGDDYTISIPVANDAYGVRLSHEKESGYNVRYYSFSLSYVGDGGTPTTYTVTYDCNGGSACPENETGIAPGTTINLADGPVKENYDFAGWSDGNTTYDEGDTYTVNGNVTFTAQWTEQSSGDVHWVLTNLADLTENDVFVIVGNGYAMTNDNGTGSAPATSAVTIENNEITSTVAANIQWTVSGNAADGYTFYPNGSTTTWLYCNTEAATSSNNNMRVGTGNRKVFELNSNNYLMTKDNFVVRYLSIYNNQDWRGYINTNLSPAMSFYKKVTGGTIPPSITANNVSFDYNTTSGEIEYTINNSVENATLIANTNDSWLTLGTVGSTSIPFTCSTNTETTARTATVILSYVNGEATLATKEVTVTQGAAPVIYSTIPALFAAATSTETPVYVTFNDWVVSGVSTNGKNVFVTDNGGNGFVIFNNNGGLDQTYSAGDILSGTAVSCTLKKYNGFAELINLNAEDLTITSGGTVSTANVAMADLTGVNTGALVHYEGLTCNITTNTAGTTTYYYLSDGTTSVQVYNAIYAFGTLVDGKTYNIMGVYQQYNSTKEILPRSADDIEEVAEPSVTVTPNTIDAPAEGADGTLVLTYENITDFISFDYYFCDVNGVELDDTDPDLPGWIYAEINEENDVYSMDYIIDANEGAVRTAYMKVYTFDDDLEEVYAIVTVNQAAAPQQYTLTVEPFENLELITFVNEEMVMETDGEIQVNEGDQIMLSIVADPEYVMETLMVNNVNHVNDIADNFTYTFDMPAENVTISATAVEDVPPVGGNYVRITSLDQLTDGSKVIIAARYDEEHTNGYYAMSGVASGKPTGEAFTSETSGNDEILPAAITTSEDTYYWTVNVTEDVYTFTNANNQMIGYTSGTNFATGGNNTAWTITRETAAETTMVAEYTGFVIRNGNTDTRAFAFNGQAFGAYATSNMTSNQAPGYNFFLDFFVQQEPVETESYDLSIVGYTDVEGEGINNRGYYLIASPVTVDPATVEGMTDGDFDLYYFDQAESDEWRNYEAQAFDLVPGKGYLYAKKATDENPNYNFTLTGIPYSGIGEIELEKADDVEFSGWNLIGNPFGSEATLDRPFYRMADGGAALTAQIGANSLVFAMEGVFVEAENHGDKATFTAGIAVGDGIDMKNVAYLNLNISKNLGGFVDNAIVRFDNGAMLGKFQLNQNSTKLYITENGKDYAIVRSANEGEMPVNFKAEQDGIYTLSVNAEEVSFAYLHLIDNMTGVETDLLANPSYSFEARTTDYANRFKLVFATGSSTDSDTFAFFSNGSFVINNEDNATLQVIDVNGRVLTSENINGCANVNLNAAAGVYMIRLVNGDNVKVQKVVVR